MNQQEEYINKYFEWFRQLSNLSADTYLYLDKEHRLMDSIKDYYVDELPNDVEFIFQINKVSKLNLYTDNLNIELDGDLWVPLERVEVKPQSWALPKIIKKYGFTARTCGVLTSRPNTNSIPVFDYFMELENEAELSNYNFGFNIRIWENGLSSD